MKILALDMATTTGYAFGPASNQSGCWKLQPSRFESAGMRFLRFEKLLAETIQKESIQLIAFEEVRAHNGIDAGHIYGGLLAVMQLVALRFNVPYKAFGVGTIKKIATGKGSANKHAMVEAAIKFFPGVHIKDDNHADALWIWQTAVTYMQDN